MKKISTALILAAVLLSSCKDYLDPLANGYYTEENVNDYPSLIRGYIDRAYYLLPNSYYDNRFMINDAATDDAALRVKSGDMYTFSTGNPKPSSYPFEKIWTKCYESIYYCNMFLKDRVGINTHYYLDAESDHVLRRCLQGDAYGLRAYNLALLLRCFGGMSKTGEMLGVPIMTKPVPVEEIDGYDLYRDTYDDCVRQILEDCDSALVYLPLANRDFLRETSEPTVCTGAVRYGCLDRVSIHALKAFVYLTWASPAFNPKGEMSRYDEAAKEAKFVIDHKLNKESTVEGGFKPLEKFLWTDPNSPEAIFVSQSTHSEKPELALYPYSFGGTSEIGPSQELVDAFPMANGFPRDDWRGGYDKSNPYAGRDPRFYATIYYDGADILRASNNKTMYTFQVADGGPDAIGSQSASPTGYYIKKFLYRGWNPKDATVQLAYRKVFFLRWTHMCLIFAEAANQFAPSPEDETTYGMSAKQALAYLRSRTTSDGTPGLGVTADPYLDECASAGKIAFDRLVRNEWRLETCFEGMRYYNLRRWGDLSALNTPVSGVSITTVGGKKTYTKVSVSKRSYESLWNPIPYMEPKICKDIVQNEGWSKFK